MKKQDIKVRINNDAEAKEVRDILLGSGEEIDNDWFCQFYPCFLAFSIGSNDWFTIGGGNELKLIEIPQLREMLQQKQTVTIEVDALDAPAFEMILKELKHARDKHPNFASCNFHAHSVLSEEVGEVARDMNDGKCFKHEASQVGAVAVRMLTELF